MFSKYLKSLSILKKFLFINFIIFTIISLFTFVYLNNVQPNLIKKKSVKHLNVIDNTINTLIRLDVKFNVDDIRKFLFSTRFIFQNLDRVIFFDNDSNIVGDTDTLDLDPRSFSTRLDEIEFESLNDNENDKNKQSLLSDVWKNKFFRSTIPLGLFNYGGIMAVQTLWAGPWMIRVSGYSPMQSATGLFWINITMLIAFFIWGYILPKITKLGIDTMRLMKLGLPISYLSLLVIILSGENAGEIHFIIYILSSIVLTLTQPAVALSFPTNLAGKSLTSFNLLIFLGTFLMQWGIGIVIDLCKFLGKTEILSFQISFTVYLSICVVSYLYFIINNRK